MEKVSVRARSRYKSRVPRVRILGNSIDKILKIIQGSQLSILPTGNERWEQCNSNQYSVMFGSAFSTSALALSNW